MPNAIPNPSVTILLSTYNGAPYLKQQLDSIVQQEAVNIEMTASDDGSTDDTLKILETYNIRALRGPQKGFAANFLSLLKRIEQKSEYYAFSDQDDVWETHKLKRAIKRLQSIDAKTPALYCARTALVDEALNPIGQSPHFKKPPSFLNALVQNIGGGNTMVFNQAACALLAQTPDDHTLFAHDWWAYLLITGAGGIVIYDEVPSMYYRQHQKNLLGNNMSFKARLKRVRMLFEGGLKGWITSNNHALLQLKHVLTPENQKILEAFEANRTRFVVPRFIRMLMLGIHRQTRLTQFGLLLGTLFNKV